MYIESRVTVAVAGDSSGTHEGDCSSLEAGTRGLVN
jgi:hypothetical protein